MFTYPKNYILKNDSHQTRAPSISIHIQKDSHIFRKRYKTAPHPAHKSTQKTYYIGIRNLKSISKRQADLLIGVGICIIKILFYYLVISKWHKRCRCSAYSGRNLFEAWTMEMIMFRPPLCTLVSLNWPKHETGGEPIIQLSVGQCFTPISRRLAFTHDSVVCGSVLYPYITTTGIYPWFSCLWVSALHIYHDDWPLPMIQLSVGQCFTHISRRLAFTHDSVVRGSVLYPYITTTGLYPWFSCPWVIALPLYHDDWPLPMIQLSVGPCLTPISDYIRIRSYYDEWPLRLEWRINVARTFLRDILQ